MIEPYYEKLQLHKRVYLRVTRRSGDLLEEFKIRAEGVILRHSADEAYLNQVLHYLYLFDEWEYNPTTMANERRPLVAYIGAHVMSELKER